MPELKKIPSVSRPTPLYTYGKAVPQSGRRACYCPDTNTYSKACCEGYLMNQGIGIIEGPVNGNRAFSSAFNNSFS